MARGGSRQGTPGAGYAQRTDLLLHRQSPTAQATPASGGVPPAVQATSQAPGTAPATWTTPDDVPRLDDPSARPMEPLTHGLESGPGGGAEVLGGPGDPTMNSLRAAYLRRPTEELARTLKIMALRGVT